VVRVDDDIVEVALTVEADHLFADALPGADDSSRMTVRASARAETP
jgi:hypothetical protein